MGEGKDDIGNEDSREEVKSILKIFTHKIPREAQL